MPKNDFDGFTGSRFINEHRGIRCGEKGASSPSKTLPRVRMPTRNPSTKKFDVDEKTMSAAAERLGFDGREWPTVVKAIPVYLTTDKIVGDGGAIYIERALYTGANRRQCSSSLGTEHAQQKIDISAYAKSKSIKVLDTPKTVECSPTACPMWVAPGQKSDCGWRAIVSVQLQDSPVFPSRSVHRTKSYYSILSMVGSLNAIAEITGGIISGIPLMFRQHLIDVRSASGENRRIPIMSFEFDGSVQELRRLAIAEMVSRDSLSRGQSGNFSGFLPEIMADRQKSLMPHMDEEDEIVSDVVDDEDSSSDVATASTEDVTRARDLESEIATTARALGYTPARMRLLESKHMGDLQAMLADLRIESGAKDVTPPSSTKAASAPSAQGSGEKWGPGEAGDEYLGADDLDF